MNANGGGPSWTERQKRRGLIVDLVVTAMVVGAVVVYAAVAVPRAHSRVLAWEDICSGTTSTFAAEVTPGNPVYAPRGCEVSRTEPGIEGVVVWFHCACETR